MVDSPQRTLNIAVKKQQPCAIGRRQCKKIANKMSHTSGISPVIQRIVVIIILTVYVVAPMMVAYKVMVPDLEK